MTRIAAGLAAAVLLGACAEGPYATGLDAARDEAAAEAATLTDALLLPALTPIEDALGRVLDGLPDVPAKDGLRTALRDLAAALVAYDVCFIRQRRMQAEHALHDLGRVASGEFEPDLDVTRLALESVDNPDGARCGR